MALTTETSYSSGVCTLTIRENGAVLTDYEFSDFQVAMAARPALTVSLQNAKTVIQEITGWADEIQTRRAPQYGTESVWKVERELTATTRRIKYQWGAGLVKLIAATYTLGGTDIVLEARPAATLTWRDFKMWLRQWRSFAEEVAQDVSGV